MVTETWGTGGTFSIDRSYNSGGTEGGFGFVGWKRGKTSTDSCHPGFVTSPRRAHEEFKHRLSDVPLPLVNCRNSFMLQVLLFYGHGAAEWLGLRPTARKKKKDLRPVFMHVCVI